jgi:hypothetical protein
MEIAVAGKIAIADDETLTFPSAVEVAVMVTVVPVVVTGGGV